MMSLLEYAKSFSAAQNPMEKVANQVVAAGTCVEHLIVSTARIFLPDLELTV